MSNAFNSNGFGDFDFSGVGCLDADLDEPPPETLPMAGTAHLVVEDKYEPLFTSAEWTIIATVGQHEIGRSSSKTQPHTEPFIKRWTRQLIRNNKERMRRLGVDIEKTYVEWGGILVDLDD